MAVERMTGRSGLLWTVSVVERMTESSGLVWTVMEAGEAQRTHVNQETRRMGRMVEQLVY